MLPNDEDYYGTMKAIHRLSETYLLEPKHLRLGNICNYKQRAIRSLDCKFLLQILILNFKSF